MGGLALRYWAVVILAAATHLAGLWFHSSGIYQGPANVPLSQFPENVDFVFVLTFAATMIGLKYVVYELAVRAFTGNYKTPAIRLCFYAGRVGDRHGVDIFVVETHSRCRLSHCGRSFPKSIGPHRICGRNRSHCSLERHASQNRGYPGSLNVLPFVTAPSAVK